MTTWLYEKINCFGSGSSEGSLVRKHIPKEYPISVNAVNLTEENLNVVKNLSFPAETLTRITDWVRIVGNNPLRNGYHIYKNAIIIYTISFFYKKLL